MDCADRAVLEALGQASDLAEGFPPEQVAVVVDSCRVRRDPDVWRSIERAGSRIASFPVCDVIAVEMTDVEDVSASLGGSRHRLGRAARPRRGRSRPRSPMSTLRSLRGDLRSTCDTAGSPARTNPASFGR
jgi:hypothetical protein